MKSANLAATAALLAACIGSAQQHPRSIAAHANSSPHWVASWATSMMATEPQNHQLGVDAARLTDATVRQIVHLSTGGPMLRLELSNAFGKRALVFDSVHVASARSASSSAIDPSTDHAVTFAGQPFAVVPPGGVYLSDPVALATTSLSNLAITFHLKDAPDGQTLHQGSRETSYFTPGDHATDAELAHPFTIDHWFNISEVDVASPHGATVVCFGDSITDGHASTTNGNDRWTDFLATHFAHNPKTHGWGVVNEGIGGNHLLTDGLGENAIGRLDRDMLTIGGAREAVLFEGINDIGMLARGKGASPAEHAQLVQAMETAMTEIVRRAHAQDIRVIGATITPFMGSDYYKPTAANEADRLAVNKWILKPGHFDGTIDLDAAMRDPQHPAQLLPAYDSGDHLHPGPVGYKAMGNAVWAALQSAR